MVVDQHRGGKALTQEDNLRDPYVKLFGFEARHRFRDIPSSKETKVDFSIPDEKRTFKLVMKNGNSLFVNPRFFSTMSEDFRKKFDTINDAYGEVSYEDVDLQDMEVVLRSVCPVLFGLYPMPVLSSQIPVILPIAVLLKLPNLMACCEKVLEENFLETGDIPFSVLTYFEYAYRYEFKIEIQAALLEKILRTKHSVAVSEKTVSTLAIAYAKRFRKEFMHKCMLESTVPEAKAEADETPTCSKCSQRRQLQLNKSRKQRNRKQRKSANIVAVLQCSKCKLYLCDNCTKAPCVSTLVSFLKKYGPSFFAKNSEKG